MTSLPSSPVDGQLGVLRIGSGQDTTDIRMRWNASRAHWVGAEFAYARAMDSVALKLTITVTTKQYWGWTGTPQYLTDLISPRRLDLAQAAGLGFEYRHSAWLQGVSGFNIHAGTYFYQYNPGDYNTPNGTTNNNGGYNNPPTGGVAETAYLSGGSSGSRVWVESDWATLLAPGGGAASWTKQSMYPAAYGYMDSGAGSSGSAWDYTIWLRPVL